MCNVRQSTVLAGQSPTYDWREGKGRCNDYVANIVDWGYLIFILLHESASDSSEVDELLEIGTNIANPIDKDDIIGDAKQM